MASVFEKELGGNIIRKLNLSSGYHKLSEEMPYDYYYLDISNDMHEISHLKSFTIFIYDDCGSNISINAFSNLQSGDCAQFERVEAKITIKNGRGIFLVAGTKSSSVEKASVKLTKYKDIYKVNKPWGHELWINGEHPDYALKEIFLKSGNKTSLQYHQFKKGDECPI